MAVSISKDDILQAISDMSVMELTDLTKAMEEKFGVSANVAFASAPAASGGGAAAAVEEKSEFSVVMTSFGENKVDVIRVVRQITDLQLIPAKKLVEALPANIKEGIPKKEEAEEIKKKLEEVGAKVEIK